MSNTAAYLETPIHEDMTLYAVWYKVIDRIEVEADPPIAGDVIGTERYETEDFSFSYQSPRPKVRSLSEGVRIKKSTWSGVGPSAFWLENPNDVESTFKGTFELGKEYGVVMDTEPIFGYEFAENASIYFNGKPLDRAHYSHRALYVIAAPILCAERLLGDADGSGGIGALDATYIQRYAAGIATPYTKAELMRGDVDDSGDLELFDVSCIQRYLAQMKTDYPIGQPAA
ncbi:MAG: dockerin type I repeat-containing protein [Ruminococcus sp.]|nr:dockerin type I repeat-containing protein [Ruminococcus sp.]